MSATEKAKRNYNLYQRDICDKGIKLNKLRNKAKKYFIPNQIYKIKHNTINQKFILADKYGNFILMKFISFTGATKDLLLFEDVQTGVKENFSLIDCAIGKIEIKGFNI